MYSDNFTGPWLFESAKTTKYVQERTVYNGQTTIVIKEVQFLWEDPEGTLVFFDLAGGRGPQGLQGPWTKLLQE
jgi:hypothetical protein